ncbi:unnamed protein product [Choristocarpus tenellus]
MINPQLVESLATRVLPEHASVISASAGSIGQREVILAARDGTVLKVDVPTVGKFRSHGKVLLTTERLVFCSSKPTTQNGIFFEGFDIPLDGVSSLMFNQPLLLGANNLSGIVQTNVATGPPGRSRQGARLSGDHRNVVSSKWHLYFREGGFGTFLSAFYKTLKRRQNSSSLPTAVAFTGTDQEWAAMQVLSYCYAINANQQGDQRRCIPAEERVVPLFYIVRCFPSLFLALPNGLEAIPCTRFMMFYPSPHRFV